MNLKNNLIVAGTFFLGHFVYFYYMMKINRYTFYYTIGLSVFVSIIVNILKQFYFGLQNKIKPSIRDEWAIITGCTSGLGYSLSKQLAEQGFNLILIGRNKELLNNLVNDISYTGVKYETMVHDFADEFDNLTYTLCKFIIGDNPDKPSKHIGLLVNNVGIALDNLAKFVDYPLQKDYDMVQININSVLSMTKAVLPIMLKQNYGYIVNISSASSLNSSPYVSTYSATKSFLDQYTRSMSHEYENTGVKFHCSNPAFFVSGMTKVKSSIFIPNNETIANCILKHLTVSTSSIPYIFHFVQMAFVKHHWYNSITKNVLQNLYYSKEDRYITQNEKKSN